MKLVRVIGAVVVNLLAGWLLKIACWFSGSQEQGRFADAEKEGLCVVTPLAPSELSGGGKAVKELLNMFSHQIPITLVDLSTCVRHVTAARRSISLLLLSGIPMLRTSKHLLLEHGVVQGSIEPGKPLFIEFSEGATFLCLMKRLKTFTILRDHEILLRRFDRSGEECADVLQRCRDRSAAFLCKSLLNNIYSKVDVIVTLTREDGDYIRDRFAGAGKKVVTIPVAFDHFFASSMAEEKKDRFISRQDAARNLLFLANLYHGPNLEGLVWFLRECAPHLDPGFTLHLCGMDGPLDTCLLPQGNISIVRHGYVDDIEDELGWVRIGISPVISGGGMRIKNLYLGASGRVVVTTPLGNEGIGYRDGHEAIIRAGGREMAEELNTLSNMSAEISRLGENAACKIRNEFSHNAILKLYREKVFEKVRAGAREGAAKQAKMELLQ